MKKILFPTDFSQTSNNAFVYALHLAQALQAEIITLHTYEYPILDANYVEVPLYQAEVYESLELGNFENYKSQIPALRRIAEAEGLAHISLRNVLLEGDLVQNIAQLVDQESIELVVMGTQGASGFGAFFFGTTTADVMTGTSAFVMSIPEQSHYEPITRIGFATTYSAEDQKVLRQLTLLAGALGARIDCLHVDKSGASVPENQAAFRAAFANENIEFYTLESHSLEDAIIEFTETHGLGLFALLNHRHGFWESLFHTSLTRKLAFHLRVPLLALHETTQTNP